MTEMRVNVADVTRIENQSRNPNCLEKFLQVQLARPREQTAARSYGLCKCNHRSTNKSRGSLLTNSVKRRQKIFAVQAKPASQRCLRERRSLWQVVRTSFYSVEETLRMQLITVFDHRKAQLHSQLLETIDLAGDEDLGQARIALQNICDCAVSYC